MTADINILVVDDVEQNLVSVEAILARPGLRMIKANSGVQALEALLVHDVALALIDVQMPGMNGFELSELIRGNSRTCDIPLIFLTAAMNEPRRNFRGYQAGAVDFLHKPIDPLVLQSKVDVFVRLHDQKRQLSEQLAELREALRLNEMFTAVLGHDLRNPLSAVLSGSSLLLQVSTEPSVVNTASRIQSSGRRMAKMVDQLLDFAHVRSGGLVVRIQQGDYGQLCRRIVDELQRPGEFARIIVETSGGMIGWFDGDRLAQVISNLVGNALKHGVAGTPVRVTVDGSDSDMMLIRVKNHGLIPLSMLTDIFKPFHSRQERKGSKGGLGLGLYIVERFVQAHGGSVSVRSTVDEGTIFTVSLPRNPPPPGRIG